MELLRKDPIIKTPDFYQASPRMEELLKEKGDSPFLKIDFSFDSPNLEDFVKTYQKMIDSGNLFQYENWEYQDIDGKIKVNLETNKSFYSKDENERWQFNLENRLYTDLNVNFPIYNQAIGWFPEIEAAHPDLVELVERYIQHLKLEPYRIFLLKVNKEYIYHVDLDGYYSFRLFLNPKKDWSFTFKKMKDEHKKTILNHCWVWNWQAVKDGVESGEFCHPGEQIIKGDDLGNTFILDNLNYIHRFVTNQPNYIIFVKGTC